MKIVVLLKQVPDTWSDRRLDATSGRVVRVASDAVTDEIDDRALEVALLYKDSQDVEIVTLALGPAAVTDSLRKSLAVGADSAVHVLDDGLAGADLALTAATLGAAIRRIGFDLVIAGSESTDGRGGVIPAMVAEHLGVPHLTYLESVDIGADSVTGTRATEGGTLAAHTPLPAVISVTERSAEPRFPNFKGIMRAKKKPMEVLTAADLALDDHRARTVVLSVAERPARSAGTVIKDEGDAGVRIADFLADARLI